MELGDNLFEAHRTPPDQVPSWSSLVAPLGLFFRLFYHEIRRRLRPNLRSLRNSCWVLLLLAFASCSILQTRPIQEMADASAAIRAAKAAGADTKSAEAFRRALDAFFSAKRDYRLKNFAEAKSMAVRARQYAEFAEFQAVKQGGVHTDVPPDLNPLAGTEVPGSPSVKDTAGIPPIAGGMNQLPPEAGPPASLSPNPTTATGTPSLGNLSTPQSPTSSSASGGSGSPPTSDGQPTSGTSGTSFDGKSIDQYAPPK